MRWRHVGPPWSTRRQYNFFFPFFFFINPSFSSSSSSSCSSFLPHFVRLFVFQGNSFPPPPPRLSGVHSIISHYFFVIMKARGFFSTVRFEDWESPTVERFTHGNEVWIRGFESFPRSGFPVNFPISRLGDHWWSVIFCSVRFFFFFLSEQRCSIRIVETIDEKGEKVWVSKFKFQGLIKDDLFFWREFWFVCCLCFILSVFLFYVTDLMYVYVLVNINSFCYSFYTSIVIFQLWLI